MFLFAEGGGAHHTPLIVEFINQYLGEPIYRFQMGYTYPAWQWIINKLGVKTTPEALFGEYSPETAIPWYTIMFVIACILTMIVIWIFKGKLSEDDPTTGQLTLEAGFVALKDLITDVVGKHGYRYFPVVATFAVLVLISNLMDFSRFLCRRQLPLTLRSRSVLRPLFIITTLESAKTDSSII